LNVIRKPPEHELSR